MNRQRCFNSQSSAKWIDNLFLTFAMIYKKKFFHRNTSLLSQISFKNEFDSYLAQYENGIYPYTVHLSVINHLFKRMFYGLLRQFFSIFSPHDKYESFEIWTIFGSIELAHYENMRIRNAIDWKSFNENAILSTVSWKEAKLSRWNW